MLKQVGSWFGHISLYPGDTVSIDCSGIAGHEKELIRYEVKRTIDITTATMYEFENEFGLKEGFAGVIGNV